jgi:predicted nucleic acid-binding protein
VLVKRYMAETGSAWVQTRCNDPGRTIVTADISRVEVAAAFASKLRAGFVTQSEYQQARARLEIDAQKRFQLLPVTSQRINEAIDLTALQKLRGYDAVQLACALYVNRALVENDLPPLVFVAADDLLLKAAEAEGLLVESPNHSLHD